MRHFKKKINKYINFFKINKIKLKRFIAKYVFAWMPEQHVKNQISQIFFNEFF